MRTISVSEVTEAVRKACGEMAFFYSTDILERMEEGRKNERGERSRAAMNMLLQNAAIAREEQIPICQDTGLVTVWIHAGQEISFTDGSLKEAVQEGVRRGYEENFLRASVVKDPLYDRVNTRDNTPAVIYCDITEGDLIKALKTKLPRYMLPNKVNRLEEMPFTANGKIDRKKKKKMYEEK